MILEQIIIPILFWLFVYIVFCGVTFALLDDYMNLDDHPELRWLVFLGPIGCILFIVGMVLHFFLGVAFYIADKDDQYDKFVEKIDKWFKKLLVKGK